MMYLKLRSYMFKFEYFYVFNPRYFGRSKLYFLSSDARKKLKFLGAIVGMRAQICILDLEPYLIMWIHPRRSKRLDRLPNRGSRTERVEEYSSRRLSFSNRMNVGQASTWAT